MNGFVRGTEDRFPKITDWNQIHSSVTVSPLSDSNRSASTSKHPLMESDSAF
ncbi:hypothetical protein JCM19039_2767 [Geomicrobium sp. JCM 19039]|nr:hypothetical protein JCM19039_2767 [Geomicrobium sp. JCM 19039]